MITFFAIILWIITIVASGYVVFIILGCFYFLIFPDRDWKKWLTLEQYWQSYPHCKTGDGVKCYKCGSRNIRQYGYEKSDDHRLNNRGNHISGRELR